MNGLELQKNLVPKHINSSWPLLRGEARALPSYSNVEQIIICGCGDSHHAGLGLAMGISLLTGINCVPVTSMTASRYLVPQFRGSAAKLLLIGISASGEVARTIESVEIANHIGANTLAFTGNASGTLARTAQESLVLRGPDLPHGPGLISYLTSLLMGYAFIFNLADSANQSLLDDALQQIQSGLEPWIHDRWNDGVQYAEQPGEGTCVFLGSGPLYGSALFGAAKLIEASGEYAWGQDVEEWAHLEYFCAPTQMRTWLLSAGGRSSSRESEVQDAARTVGRFWHADRWDLLLHSEASDMNEICAPLALWAGPFGYAARRTELQSEIPFRDFGGGRDWVEGGGASKIRSSERLLFYHG